jgi:hypothetical protein
MENRTASPLWRAVLRPLAPTRPRDRKGPLKLQDTDGCRRSGEEDRITESFDHIFASKTRALEMR